MARLTDFHRQHYLSNKPENFVNDPEKLYRLRRREAQQAKKLDFVDSKSEDEGSLESPKNPPPQSPRENQLPPMGEQPQERKIGELCTPNIIDLPILNLTEIRSPFESVRD
jgi:adenine-specific DNA methylase